MALNGYVKLFRSLKDWEWYNNKNVKIVFLDLLLIVNFKDTKWQGIDIKRGQVVIGLEKYAKSLGLTIQELRTVFKKLKKTGELTTKSTNKNTIVTLVNFEVYQDEQIENNNQINNQITNEQQTNNKQITNEQQQRNNDKNNNNDKKEKNKYSFIAEFQKIKNGEAMRRTELEKRFHFGLFKDEWSTGFCNQILKFWRYLESKK
jgi:hypothetical protein